MSRVIASRRSADHFEPDDDADPKAQRHLRGLLDQIDYAAYAANRKVLSNTLSNLDLDQFQRLATAAAVARTRWAAAALVASEGSQGPTPEQIRALTLLRTTYEELTEAYDAMRRMVERGYLTFTAPVVPKP